MTLVIDASVAVKWNLDEPDSAPARHLIDLEPDLVAPDLILAEVGNVLWRRSRRGDIDLLQSQRALKHLPGPLTLLSVAPFDHPVYDCIDLAAAEALQVPRITVGRRMEGRLRDQGWAGAILAPAEWLNR